MGRRIDKLRYMEVVRCNAAGMSINKTAAMAKVSTDVVIRIRRGDHEGYDRSLPGDRKGVTQSGRCPDCGGMLRRGTEDLPNNSCVACATRRSVKIEDHRRYTVGDCDIEPVDLSGEGLPEGAESRYQDIRKLIHAGREASDE